MSFNHLHPIKRFQHILALIFKDAVLHGLTLCACLFIGVAMVFYHNVEGWKWIDAFYFSIVTLSTVGYGDVTPHTELGKIFTIIYILIGMGLFATLLTNLGVRILSFVRQDILHK